MKGTERQHCDEMNTYGVSCSLENAALHPDERLSAPALQSLRSWVVADAKTAENESKAAAMMHYHLRMRRRPGGRCNDSRHGRFGSLGCLECLKRALRDVREGTENVR